LKTLVPLVVHQNSITGEVWVTHPDTSYTPENDAQVQSDIVRYLTARESYSAADLNQRFQLVNLLSSKDVAKNYSNEQSNANPNAPVNTLGHEGTQTIHIEDIVFLDKAGIQELRHFKEKSQNLAKVDFITITTDKSGNKVNQAWVATVSWIYAGLPKTQVEAWENWNGFTVTSFRIDPRNLSTTEPRS
ncbi:MAG TPA: type IV secretion system protein, partial [Coxiellaceae bacterium]|nr:type IV secretion system protein [Coxiellaceae bacterium]